MEIGNALRSISKERNLEWKVTELDDGMDDEWPNTKNL